MKKGVFIDKNGGKSDLKKKKKIEIQNLKRSETAGFRSETGGFLTQTGVSDPFSDPTPEPNA